MRLPWRRGREPLRFEVPVSTLTRKTLYSSMIGDPREIGNLLGLPPISAEVDEMERLSASERLYNISDLKDIIALQSAVVAKASVQFQNQEIEGFTGPMTAALEVVYEGVAFSSAMAVVSTLVEIGILNLAGEK